MAHIRVLRHYIHTPFVLTAGLEAVLVYLAAFTGFYTRFGAWPTNEVYWITSVVFSISVVFSMTAMGVYESRLREGYAGMMLRTAVSIFLLGTMIFAIVAFFVPLLEMGRGVLLFSVAEAYIFVAVSRWLTKHFIKEDALKTRVLVLGCGHRAKKIASRMRRKSDQRAFVLLGYLQTTEVNDEISDYGAKILTTDLSLAEYCKVNRVQEIVVAMDERRRDENAPGMPIDALLECKTSGIEICEVQAFIERESAKVDVDLLRPSWMIFSDGFVASPVRAFVKNSFDWVAALFVLALVWPLMLLTALAIGMSSLFRDPILYRQERVGLDGKLFSVLKFRSMQVDAEKSGAVWAIDNDPRVTKIGTFIRKTRIDELPQLFNVLKGDMSFVGPRPERPVFVEEISESVPYYEQRHKVKPGITGWAQLCYPYGASVEDAKEKLQYDLYYLKNHSLLLDLIILVQTVEVVLIGEGAR